MASRDVERRKWDVAAFEARARARARAEEEEGRGKGGNNNGSSTLSGLDVSGRERVRFESRVGTTEILKSARGGGFHCKVCDALLKDSNRYLAHVNSRAHQRALGMGMRVARATVEEVEAAFQMERERLLLVRRDDDDENEREAHRKDEGH